MALNLAPGEVYELPRLRRRGAPRRLVTAAATLILLAAIGWLHGPH